MNQTTAKRICDIGEQRYIDNALAEEYEAAHKAFLEMVDTLSENQRDILMDYLGVCIEIHLRMLEKAIEMK